VSFREGNPAVRRTSEISPYGTKCARLVTEAYAFPLGFAPRRARVVTASSDRPATAPLDATPSATDALTTTIPSGNRMSCCGFPVRKTPCRPLLPRSAMGRSIGAR